MKLDLEDGVSMRGDLVISLDYGNGRLEKFYEKQNMIVKSAKLILLRTIYVASSVDYVATLQVGNGTNLPLEADALQTDLVSRIVGVSSAVTPTPDDPTNSVNFVANISNVQANGYTITEAGLFTSAGYLFSVKNHPGIAKSSAFSIRYDWTLRIL